MCSLVLQQGYYLVKKFRAHFDFSKTAGEHISIFLGTIKLCRNQRDPHSSSSLVQDDSRLSVSAKVVLSGGSGASPGADILEILFLSRKFDPYMCGLILGKPVSSSS